MDETTTWEFYGMPSVILTYESGTERGIGYSRIIARRPRRPDDPPVPSRPFGTWEQKGTTWIFTHEE